MIQNKLENLERCHFTNLILDKLAHLMFCLFYFLSHLKKNYIPVGV